MDEYERVRDFYYDVIRSFQDAEYDPQWEIGIYPTDEHLYTSIEKQRWF